MAPRKDDIIQLLIGLLLGVLFGWFFILPYASAADLSTDPMDTGASSASVVIQSEDPEPEPEEPEAEPEPEPQEPDDSEVVYSDDDIIWNDQVEPDLYPDTFNESQDVVVNRQDLEEVIALLNDLSDQLSLYTSDTSGREPSEEDLTYRENLLLTLSGIHDSLMVLTEPPQEEVQEEAQEEPMEDVLLEGQAEADTSAPSDASTPADASAPAETDPADSDTAPADASADTSMEDTSISEQDFYKLVLALLLVLVSVPFISWAYKFISSFFPV